MRDISHRTLTRTANTKPERHFRCDNTKRSQVNSRMGFWSSPMRPVIRTHKPTNSWRTVEAHGGDQDTDRFARTHTTVVALTRALANFRPCRKTPSPGAECGDCHRRAYLIIGKSYIMHPVTNSTRFRVWGHAHQARRLGQAYRLGALLNDLYYAGTRDGPGGRARVKHYSGPREQDRTLE